MEKIINQASLQDEFLNSLFVDKREVSVYLTNGIQLQGRINGYDHDVLIITGRISMLVYKHAISTIMPLMESEKQQLKSHSLYGRRYNSNQKTPSGEKDI